MTQRVAHITVPGVPIAQPRHQVGRNGAYIPKDHKIHAYRHDVLKAWLELDPVYGRQFDGAVSVGITFYFPRPKRLKLTAGTVPKVTRPDLDNLAKGVLDALQNFAFGDDSCVTELRLSKWFVRDGMDPHTAISIKSEE